MRSIAVVALSILALGAGIAGAEARGFRLRGFGHVSASRPVPPRVAAARSMSPVVAVGSIGPSYALRSDTSVVTRSVVSTKARSLSGDATAEDTQPIPPMPPAPVAARKAAEPWCRSGRIAGQGSGFCLIN